ncbi:hypothetical protein HYDPIDRAFT_170850 [Hydnomerulius pinastri MD-312]|uniref:Uncharacterized protein n=1 Tax=Hydnomerulius pinastri MD-312 TaxID=994086 RepID=A0A0C9W923_9AGAM|nr:hypothetical protein HYDPIDRAFT_170850 [Hydnomerulius pinastri MD-312]
MQITRPGASMKKHFKLLLPSSGRKSMSPSVPYTNEDGRTPLICNSGTEKLNITKGRGVASNCPVCCVATKDIRSHMGIHILRAARGITDTVVTPITGMQPCGFCGRSGHEECNLTLKKLARSIKWTSHCPRQEDFKYGNASKGSENHPCRNVPVVCLLCEHLLRETDTHNALWRYNMEAHLNEKHPEYAHPGRPDGIPLPRDMYELIHLTELEQKKADAPPRAPFSNIQDKENTAPPQSTHSETQRRRREFCNSSSVSEEVQALKFFLATAFTHAVRPRGFLVPIPTCATVFQ